MGPPSGVFPAQVEMAHWITHCPKLAPERERLRMQLPVGVLEGPCAAAQVFSVDHPPKALAAVVEFGGALAQVLQKQRWDQQKQHPARRAEEKQK